MNKKQFWAIAGAGLFCIGLGSTGLTFDGRHDDDDDGGRGGRGRHNCFKTEEERVN